MGDDLARLRHLRHAGWWLAALSLAVVAVSAWLRLAGAGLGCPDWPGCYASLLTAGAHAPPAVGRMLHRIVATSALLLAVYACWRSMKPTPLPRVMRQAFMLLGLMLLLSAVGIWSSDPRRLLVNFVNLLGGLALVSMAWRFVQATVPDPGAHEVPRRAPLLTMGMAMLGATVMLGAVIGARYAALDDSVSGLALHWLHRICAVLTFLLLGQAALLRREHVAAQVMLALLGLEMLLGAMLVLGGFPLWAGVAHNVLAAMLLAASVQLRQPAVPESARCGG